MATTGDLFLIGWFLRLKSANQKQELPVAAMFVNWSGQNVQSLDRTFYRCFLPSFSSFGWGVSEEKIKMWKVNGRQTTDAKSDNNSWVLVGFVLLSSF
jgi:hypothetical protein